MKFNVLKRFTWAGCELKVGDVVEIPDESPKIGSLVKAKFIRFEGNPPPKPLSQVEEVAKEIKAEEKPAATVVEGDSSVSRDPKDIVRQAKAKATAKK